MNNRQEINLKILNQLKQYIEKYPDIRFCQLLYMLNFYNEDKFYEESKITLEKITNLLPKDQ